MNNYWINQVGQDEQHEGREKIEAAYRKRQPKPEPKSEFLETYESQWQRPTNSYFGELVYGNRKLKCRWSMEAAEDLRVNHDINIAQELSNRMVAEIQMEIDREIIADLRNAYGFATEEIYGPRI